MSTEARDSQCEHQEQEWAADPAGFKAITQIDLMGKLMDASCIKGKFCENNKVGKTSCSSSCKNWSHWRWNQNLSATTGNLITRSLPPWFTVEAFSTIHQHNPTTAVLPLRADEPILKSVQNKYFKKSLLAMKKRIHPYIFRVLLHIFAHYFCFEN